MTRPKILFSRRARADLLEIEAYISDRDGQQRGELVIGRLRETIRTLGYRPGIGSSRAYLDRESRAFPVGPWIVIYLPLPALDGIRVRRVIDGRRDLKNIL